MTNEINEMLAAWDAGDTIWSIELGGLGPGYEQAIQIAAVECARACKDLQGIIPNDKASTERFRAECDKALHKIDDDVLGLSGAMAGQAQWLAFQWCVMGGPRKLQERMKSEGKSDRAIQVSKAWPKAPDTSKATP